MNEIQNEIQTEQNLTPEQQDLLNQLNALAEEAKIINQKIDEDNKKANNAMDEYQAKVDEAISKINKIFSELDQAEKEASDGLDKVLLQQAEDLADEE
ncbi:MAG: hypothetical protein A2606_01175 [Candidatus Yanofskybacteria bacterium RIFOXYD1_FULL_42_10]|uniref:Uncharacterized protein n=2 Tax=Parcubacteria group TaxID=1794811 RepID=A0A1F8HVK3_9BACT|nr:MAG: hypothetical protein UU83_C0040G0003 [Candidatus Jorgensenbacteria bacterium GW2011_GWF2_41_8]OGN09387.1 MAG: hypothetical protein A3C64_01175 [Candidatus Yanofskybacteria bacterium RIFCSPHIGHO2_02_FULL_41_12]OGN41605.1 MAG: hypothetical protein A2606_01175 [Candidatus Yanofskybacteria bacterium RIFOXYD1_FULL_42_10]